MDLNEFRLKNPAYKDVPDDKLADGIYRKWYAGKMPRADFDAKIGFTQTAPAPASVIEPARAARARSTMADFPTPMQPPAIPAASGPNLPMSLRAPQRYNPQPARTPAYAPDSEMARIAAVTAKDAPRATPSGPTMPMSLRGPQRQTVRTQPTFLLPDQERAFRAWYGDWAARTGIDPNPDDPRHAYDYRGAFLARAEPTIGRDGKPHWPSVHKLADHPNRFVEGVDTITGERLPPYRDPNKLYPEMGRAKSAASGFAEGAVGTLAGVPKGLAETEAASAYAMLWAFDQMDRGGDPYVFAKGPDGIVNDALLGFARMYEQSTPERREEIRADAQANLDPRRHRAYDIGTAMEMAGEDMFGKPDPAYQGEILQTLAEGGGSVASFMGTGLLGKALRLPGSVTVAGTGALVNVNAQFQDAMAHGASIETALAAAVQATPTGMTEAVPIAKWLDRVDRGTGGGIRRVIVNALKEGTEEALQEASTAILNNAQSQRLYDHERDTLEGVGQQAAAGGGVGAIFGFLTSLLPGRERGGTIAETQADAAAIPLIPTGAQPAEEIIGATPDPGIGEIPGRPAPPGAREGAGRAPETGAIPTRPESPGAPAAQAARPQGAPLLQLLREHRKAPEARAVDRRLRGLLRERQRLTANNLGGRFTQQLGEVDRRIENVEREARPLLDDLRQRETLRRNNVGGRYNEQIGVLDRRIGEARQRLDIAGATPQSATEPAGGPAGRPPPVAAPVPGSPAAPAAVREPRKGETAAPAIRRPDLRWFEGAVAEVLESDRGYRMPLIDPARPWERDWRNPIIGVPSTAPDWFKTSGWTRDQVARVAEKVAAGEPLGRDQARIAGALIERGRSMREENVRQMLAAREKRPANAARHQVTTAIADLGFAGLTPAEISEATLMVMEGAAPESAIEALVLRSMDEIQAKEAHDEITDEEFPPPGAVRPVRGGAALPGAGLPDVRGEAQQPAVGEGPAGDAPELGDPREARAPESIGGGAPEPAPGASDPSIEAAIEAGYQRQQAKARADLKAGIDARNENRRALVDWFNAAGHGDELVDSETGATYRVSIRDHPQTGRTKTLALIDEDGQQTGVYALRERKGKLDGVVYEEMPTEGLASNPTTAMQDASNGLGAQLRVGQVTPRKGEARREPPPKVPEGTLPAEEPAAEAGSASKDKNARLITLAKMIVDNMPAKDAKLTTERLQRIADAVMGGALAEGKYDRKDLYDAVELAINIYIKRTADAGQIDMDTPAQAKAYAEWLRGIIDKFPTQTVRSQEQVQFQQFSTPPDYAFAVNWIANIRDGETVLEPSAGTGNIAVHATAFTNHVHANELSPRRAAMLKALGTVVHTEDAEQLGNILPDDVKPTVVVMNPPFSQTAGRMGDKRDLMVGARHIEQALKRLEPGGRLVAIVAGGSDNQVRKSEGMSFDAATYRDWWSKIRKAYNVRANVLVDGSVYRKNGTDFRTRLLVIDKTGPTPGTTLLDSVVREPTLGTPIENIPALIDILSEVRNARQPAPRPTAEPAPDQPGGPGAPEGGEGGPRPRGESARPEPRPVGPGTGRPGAAARPEREGEPGAGGRPAAGVEARPADELAGPQPGRPGGERAGEQLTPVDRGGGEPEAGGAADTGASAQPSHGEQPGLAESGEPVPGLAVEQQAPEAPEAGELTEAVYETYKPQRLKVPGAQPHPGALVQSAAMNAVNPPPPTYTPKLPKDLIDKGALSLAQLEAIVYAGQAHGKMLAAPEPKEGEAKQPPRRRGYFIGDGTGVGKGREVAGIILDNWNQGRRRAVWVSEKAPLLKDAQRDWSGLGQDKNALFMLNRFKTGAPITAARGIAFTTYDTIKGGLNDQKALARGGYIKGQRVMVSGATPGLTSKGKDVEGEIATTKPTTRRGATFYQVKVGDKTLTVPSHQLKALEAQKPDAKSRIDQLVQWLGEDFDGVIAFDEAHNMGNSLATTDGMHAKDPSDKALAGLELQQRLPNARVVYVSATGATEVLNLAYADRLGIWGPGTPFASVLDFIDNIESGGIAAMELVARDLKAMGLYIARNLSYDGVEYDRLDHTLSAPQREIYDDLATAWQGVLENIHGALKLTGGDTSARAKSAAMSAFWGAHQRFFNQIITAMQMPSVLKAIEKDLAAGRQAVLQLVNTNESSTQRAAARAMEAGDDLEDLDLTPRDQLIEFIRNSFPTAQYETYVDPETGNERTRLVKDSSGNTVENKEAAAARDALILKVQTIRVPDSPLDYVLDHFGADSVAEITGRSQRFVRKRDPATGELKRIREPRGASSNVVDADAFQDGKKKILIFSQAGGTGRSYHADNTAKSKGARRVHYLVQAGWRADTAVQGFGRTHRTNQASAPIFRLVTTDLKGQKRFISSIARRLAQLGALTKGQRQAGDQGAFSARDNLESREAKDALQIFFRRLHKRDLEGLNIDEFEKQTGLRLRQMVDGQPAGLREDLPPIPQLLNRLLSMRIEMQNRVFEHFESIMDGIIERRSMDGALDRGLVTFRADKIRKDAEKIVYTDPESEAETKYVKVTASNRTHPVAFETVRDRKPQGYVESGRGKFYAVFPAKEMTSETGDVVKMAKIIGPMDSRVIVADALENEKNWTAVPKERAAARWAAEVKKAPEFEHETIHLITGTILPIWDRLAGSVSVVRMQAEDGERLLGRKIPEDSLGPTLERLGVKEGQQQYTADRVVEQVLDRGATAILANGWRIGRRTVAGEDRIELTGPSSWSEVQQVKGEGVFSETIASRPRYFIPTGADAARVLGNIIKARPVVRLERASGTKAMIAYHGTPHDFDRFELSERTERTGEGAMAYGYGLYFAGKKAIAEHYKKVLSRDQFPDAVIVLDHTVMRHGKPLEISQDWHRDVADLIDFARGRNLTESHEIRRALESPHGWWASNLGRVATARRAFDAIAEKGSFTIGPVPKPGRLYEVEIPENEDFLDWDRPLSEQSEKVKAALAKIPRSVMGSIDDQLDAHGMNPMELDGEYEGGKLYQALKRYASEDALPGDTSLGGNPAQEASMYLKRLGIPGHRFRDAASRGGKGSETFNYVIYSHDDVAIRTKAQAAPAGWGKVEGTPDRTTKRLLPDVEAETTPATARKREALKRQITQMIVQMSGNRKTAVEIADLLYVKIPGGWNTVGGFHNDAANMIGVALDQPEFRPHEWAGRHEIIHLVREMGLLTPAEWARLERHVEAFKLLDHFDIPERYAHLGREAQLEEAIAETFGAGRVGQWPKLPGPVRQVLIKIDRFLQRIAALVRRVFGRDATVADIFTGIESGYYARRDAAEERAMFAREPKPADAMAEPSTEKTDQGDQFVMPGVEPVAAQPKAKQPKPQKGVEELPLFDLNARKQGTMAMAMPARKPAADPAEIRQNPPAPLRQANMQTWLSKGQPIDRALRMPFDWFGGVNEQGQWQPGLKLTKAAGRIIGEAKFSPDGRFARHLNPILESARAGLIDRYGLTDEYITKDRQRALDERRIMLQGAEILKTLKEHSVGAAESRVLQAILTGETVGAEDMAALAAPIRQAIDDLGAEAVSLGLVSPESFERNRGTYLRRVYLKHEEDATRLGRWVGQFMGRKRKRIIGDQLKGRGIFLDVEMPRVMRDVPGFREGTAGPAIKGQKLIVLDRIPEQDELQLDQQRGKPKPVDRVFWPADKPIPERFADYTNRGAWEVRQVAGRKVTLWRDYTKPEREQMGEVLDARYTIAKTFMLMAHDLATGRFYKDIAENEEWTVSAPPSERWVDASEMGLGRRLWGDSTVKWVRVPDATIPDTGGKKRWGGLAGKWVRAEIWRDLNELNILNRPNLWRVLLTQWKLNKTARSPVVHMNNVMSNFFLMDMADVRLQDFAAGVRAYATSNADFQDALDHGVFGVDMMSAEIRKTVLEPVLREIRQEALGGQAELLNRFGMLGKFAEKLWAGLKAVDGKMVDFYRVEDDVFRMAAYMRHKANGLSPEQAAAAAREEFIDYDIRAPWVNFARNSVLPFISYTYRAAPLVARMIATRPWKFGKYALLAYMANALAYMMAPGDEDEERRSMREEERGYTWLGSPRMMRMPWRDRYGNPVFLDVRRWIPAADVFDVGQGSAAMPIPAPINFGGPIMLGAEFFLNKKAFDGEEITNDADTPLEATGKVADWALKSWLPSAAWIPGSWYYTKLFGDPTANLRGEVAGAIGGETDAKGRPLQPEYVIPSAFGVKLKPQDVESGFYYQRRDIERNIEALEDRIREARRNLERKRISPETFERQLKNIQMRIEGLARKHSTLYPKQRQGAEAR